ncbi:MAG: hypothetical protein WBW04_18170 [Nitrolancea sp.]
MLTRVYRQRKQRFDLDVRLEIGGSDNGPLEIGVTNRSSKAATIRRVNFDIHSDDLTSAAKRSLRQRVILTESPSTVLTDSEPVVFRLMRSTSGSDATQSTSIRELVGDLSELGVETAELTGVVLDEKGCSYRSNTLHILVYQMVRATSTVNLTNPHSATA